MQNNTEKEALITQAEALYWNISTAKKGIRAALNYLYDVLQRHAQQALLTEQFASLPEGEWVDCTVKVKRTADGVQFYNWVATKATPAGALTEEEAVKIMLKGIEGKHIQRAFSNQQKMLYAYRALTAAMAKKAGGE